MMDRTLPSGTFKFRLLIDTSGEWRVTAQVRQVVWASMRNTDIGVFELDVTVGFLRGREIPVARVFPDEKFLRAASWRFEEAYDLIELVWTFRGFLRDECADVSGRVQGRP